MTPSPYQKLTPRQRSVSGFSQAWLGPDHLLVVTSTRLTERYQRFALTDIQSISIGDAPRRAGWQVAAIAASLLWMLLASNVSSWFTRGFFLATGGLVLTLAIRDIARGPRCRCTLQTAVSLERLFPVSRLPVATRFLAVITPAIQAAQVSLQPTQASATITLDDAMPPPLPYELRAEDVPQPPPFATVQPPRLTKKRSYIAEALFVLLLLDAGIVWMALTSSGTGTASLLPTVYSAEVVLAVVALAQRSARLEGIGFGLVIACLVFTIVDILTVSGVAAWLTLIDSSRTGRNRFLLNSLWLSPTGTLLFSTLWRGIAGVVGLTLTWLDRRTPHA